MSYWKEKKKILFLYTEMAGYFYACVQQLVKQHPAEVHIVCYPVVNEAPFRFPHVEDIHLSDRKKYNYQQLEEMVQHLSPDIIFCSGWKDKDYLKICRQYRKDIPIVLLMDNQWENTLKQNLAVWLGAFFIKKHFTHCWVPEDPQYTFARKLGFSENQVFKGAYSCDYNLFHDHYQKIKSLKEKKFPRIFLYVGRYNKIKGIGDLWEAFIELQKDTPNEWQLWCAGTGDLKDAFPQHPKIKDLGFLQPEKLIELIKDAGVFVLTTGYYEHWGVAIHEFASAGFPMICSNKAGATTAFLKDNYNGFVYEANHIQSLKKAMRQMVSLSGDQLLQMGERSTELAKKITPETWAAVPWKILTEPGQKTPN